MARSLSADERIRQINELENTRFVRWHGDFSNNNSKAVVVCRNGHERTSSVSNLVNHKRGCNKCRLESLRADPQSQIDRINDFFSIRFIGWVDGYSNQYSKALIECCLGHVFESSPHDLIHKDRGCPRCSVGGFDPYTFGDIYALESECGKYVKVGISNDYKRRMSELKRKTPFKFNEIAHRTFVSGEMAAKAEKYCHNCGVTASFHGFDWCTEWFVINDEIKNRISEVMNDWQSWENDTH